MRKTIYKAFYLILIIQFLSLSVVSYSKNTDTKRQKAIDLIGEGEKLEKAKNYNAAIDKYFQSIEMEPRAAAYYRIAKCYSEIGELEKAKTYYEKTLEITPNYKDAEKELEMVKTRIKTGQKFFEGKKEILEEETRPQIAESDNPAADTKNEIKNEAKSAAASEATDTLPPPADINTIIKENKENDTNTTAKEEAKTEPVKVEKTSGKKGIVIDKPEIGSKKDSKKNAKKEDADSAESGKKSETKEENTKSATQDDVNKIMFPNIYDKKEDKEQSGYLEGKSVNLLSFDYHKGKAEFYKANNHYNAAIGEYIDALKYNPEEKSCLLELAELYGKVDRTQKAEETFNKYIDLYPKDPKGYFKFANFYFMLEDYANAEKQHKEALSIDPKYLPSLNNMGVMLMKQKKFTEAEQYFEKVIAADAQYTNAYLNMGIIAEQHRKDSARAISYYEKYLSLNGEKKAEVEKWIENLKKQQ